MLLHHAPPVPPVPPVLFGRALTGYVTFRAKNKNKTQALYWRYPFLAEQGRGGDRKLLAAWAAHAVHTHTGGWLRPLYRAAHCVADARLRKRARRLWLVSLPHPPPLAVAAAVPAVPECPRPRAH